MADNRLNFSEYINKNSITIKYKINDNPINIFKKIYNLYSNINKDKLRLLKDKSIYYTTIDNIIDILTVIYNINLIKENSIYFNVKDLEWLKSVLSVNEDNKIFISGIVEILFNLLEKEDTFVAICVYNLLYKDIDYDNFYKILIRYKYLLEDRNNMNETVVNIISNNPIKLQLIPNETNPNGKEIMRFINSNNSKLYLVRNYDDGPYKLPKGKVKLDENFIDASKRELKEELGIQFNEQPEYLYSYKTNHYYNYIYKKNIDIIPEDLEVSEVIEVNIYNPNFNVMGKNGSKLKDLIIKNMNDIYLNGDFIKSKKISFKESLVNKNRILEIKNIISTIKNEEIIYKLSKCIIYLIDTNK